ncbi:MULTISPECIES: HlyU family transcriptional regulator [unclassified Aureimonas]|uniref:HlyU family transcriptional regulator n=1 Tax=unclassified Aureimonas TaxID=2615206 RepID=UPI0007007095|nr:MULTISPECIES: HlyU family transcriptional regulator [unclassified Aureimonas]KQT69603.1 hypothetical protein ASG62_00205 [Aureimonas sp. Leaf427]KQT80954.1 hypothetical protein ASG54_05735 [Aureimonas sp. Leaf460]
MSFLKKLFGGGEKAAATPSGPSAPVAEETYRDLLIEATPIKEGGQYRLAGTVSKGSGEARREHRFVRADVFQTADEAAHSALRKGRQLIDEQGDALFRD